ncbi:MAG TPA: HAD-IC family P-type ATPase, partial [Polyangiaceae bacterium]|nr:HAD-IC family P-type ATPase [Polyangiaceae bacterium]
RVLVVRWRFQYFCSQACEQTFRERLRKGDDSIAIPTTPSPVAAAVRSAIHEATATPLIFANDPRLPSSLPPAPLPLDARRLLTLRIATLALSALQLLLIVAEGWTWTPYLRVAVASSALLTLGLSERSPGAGGLDVNLVKTLRIPVGFCLLLVLAIFAESTQVTMLANCGALAVAALSVSRRWQSVAQHAADVDLQQLLRHADAAANRVVNGQPTVTSAEELHPGQEVVLSAGDVIPVDAVIAAGSARVRPWMNADHNKLCREGDPVLAGAQILEGTAHAVVTWTGQDRALLRLLVAPGAAAETHGVMSRWSNVAATRLSWLTALGVLALLAVLRLPWEHTFAIALLAHLWLANPVSATVAALELRKVALSAARNGIAFHDAAVLDRAGSVSIAVFCSRGSLLLATPELVAVESVGRARSEEVFQLASGALGSVSHPNAQALYRAAQARGIVADAVRNHDHLPGLGVTAVSSTGQSLVVGNRALMLKQKISIASAEQRLIELEGNGLSVLLVALDQHLIGFVALQDGVRRGARAAVTALHTVHIEPVMLSGDARETCEAVGKSIGIDHIRPEVLPAERANEIKRLTDAGAVVAVIGKSPADLTALAAADVSIALGAAGSTVPGIGIALGSDELQAAARALTLARHAKRMLWVLVSATLLPGAAGLLLALLGVPAWVMLALVVLGMTCGMLLPVFWQYRSQRDLQIS